jgi:hypothetical protein
VASEFVRTLAIEQRNRLIAGLMGFFEQTVEPQLPREKRQTARRAYREKVMQCAGQYHDFVLDCLKASVADDGSVVNEEALRLLQQLHNDVRELRGARDG